MKKISIIFLLSLAAPLFAQLDATKWYATDNVITGAAPSCEFASNVTVNGGDLNIAFTDGTYTCAGGSSSYGTGLIVSAPFSFQYGKAVARIQFGANNHWLYSAFWLEGGLAGSSGYPPTCIAALRAGGYPVMDACTGSAQTTTEIDIAECVGTSSLKNNLILWQNGSVINAWVMYTSLNGNASDSFHIYELDWYPTLLVFKMDGQITNTIAQSVQVPMFLLFDDEARTLPTGLPTALTVDWVRVCSDPNAACNPGDSTMIFDDEFNVGVVPISTSNQGEKKQGQKAQ